VLGEWNTTVGACASNSVCDERGMVRRSQADGRPLCPGQSGVHAFMSATAHRTEPPRVAPHRTPGMAGRGVRVAGGAGTGQEQPVDSRRRTPHRRRAATPGIVSCCVTGFSAQALAVSACPAYPRPRPCWSTPGPVARWVRAEPVVGSPDRGHSYAFRGWLGWRQHDNRAKPQRRRLITSAEPGRQSCPPTLLAGDLGDG